MVDLTTQIQHFLILCSIQEIRSLIYGANHHPARAARRDFVCLGHAPRDSVCLGHTPRDFVCLGHAPGCLTALDSSRGRTSGDAYRNCAQKMRCGAARHEASLTVPTPLQVLAWRSSVEGTRRGRPHSPAPRPEARRARASSRAAACCRARRTRCFA